MENLFPTSSLTRRRFIKTTGAAVALAQSAWARGGRASASNRITIGVIGWGMMGPANTKAFLAEGDCQVVAACDLHAKHLQTAVDTINTSYGNKDCKAYHDYRELLARDDVDAIMIAIPDQWHAIVATEAAARKKDIYGEKRLCRRIKSSGRPAHGNVRCRNSTKRQRSSATVSSEQ
jgi:ornithine cyclodeaminase/alanine dehydrogenase-like protein (mu-crystallin family)